MKKPAAPRNREEQLGILESVALVYSPAEERFDRIMRLCRRTFYVRSALVVVVAGRREWFKASSGLAGDDLRLEVSFCRDAVRDDPVVLRDATKHPELAGHEAVHGAPHVRFCAGYPVRSKGATIGSLCILDDQPREFSLKDMEALKGLAAMAEVECGALDPDQTHVRMDESEEEHRDLLIDELTGCWNREALEYMLPREIALSHRGRSGFSYLHAELVPAPAAIPGLSPEEADGVLKEAATRLKRSLRPYDLVARIGPARFAIYAPSCSAEVSELLADRVCARVSSAPFPVRADTRSIEIKAGIVAAGPGDDDLTPARLTEVADLALRDALASSRSYVRLLI